MRPVSGTSAAATSGQIQRRYRALAQDRAVGVVGIGGDAQDDPGVIGPGRAQQQPGDLGGFAEAQRQQAGGQRIERAGVAALPRPQQPARGLQRLVRAQAGGLVQQQDAIEATVGNSGHGGCRSGFSRDRVSSASARLIRTGNCRGSSPSCRGMAPGTPATSIFGAFIQPAESANRAAGCGCARHGRPSRRSGSATPARGAASSHGPAACAVHEAISFRPFIASAERSCCSAVTKTLAWARSRVISTVGNADGRQAVLAHGHVHQSAEFAAQLGRDAVGAVERFGRHGNGAR